MQSWCNARVHVTIFHAVHNVTPIHVPQLTLRPPGPRHMQHRPPHGSSTHPPLPPELLAQVHRLSPSETRFLGVFSLCLSRACLGKLIAFSIKWRKRCGFPAPGLWEVGVSLSPAFSQPPSHLLEQQCPPCEKRHSFLSFPYACPEPVLVK